MHCSSSLDETVFEYIRVEVPLQINDDYICVKWYKALLRQSWTNMNCFSFLPPCIAHVLNTFHMLVSFHSYMGTVPFLVVSLLLSAKNQSSNWQISLVMQVSKNWTWESRKRCGKEIQLRAKQRRYWERRAWRTLETLTVELGFSLL